MKETDSIHEVVCNQPVVLGAGVQNKIFYNFSLNNQKIVAKNQKNENPLQNSSEQIPNSEKDHKPIINLAKPHKNSMSAVEVKSGTHRLIGLNTEWNQNDQEGKVAKY